MKGDQTLKTTISLSILLLLLLQTNTHAISKVYSGRRILPTYRDLNGAQFVKVGRPLTMSIEETPIVVYVDRENNTVKFTIHGSPHPDSIIYYFIPGDLFSAQIATSVEWDSVNQFYRYDYQIHSKLESKIPIKTVSMRLAFEPLKSNSPNGWGLNKNMGYHGWSYGMAPMIMPGQSVGGFGFHSKMPPTLGELYLSGITEVLGGGTDPTGYSQLSKYLNDHGRVECLVLIPAPKPERIEAVDWVNQIIHKLGYLSSNGYLQSEQRKDIYDILSDLYYQLRDAENSTFEKWNPLVNRTLAALSPYQSQIETEAWIYITENLKYMQRNRDIVWIGEYVKLHWQKDQ